MAQRTRVVLIDDLDGREIAENGQTIAFSFDGVDYTIDLNQANAETFRKAISPYLKAGDKLAGRKARGRVSETPPQTRAVRAWAASNGIQLSSRGRVPTVVIERYKAAGH